MAALRIYTEDLQIASALIKRDGVITRRYLYKQCYPLFKSIYDSYYTDCSCCKEFIDEVYLVVLSPSKHTGKCQLENYRGESTLTSWLKTVCLFYCYDKYELKQRLPVYEPLQYSTNKDNDDSASDRIDEIYGSVEIDFSELNRHDALEILKQMPNKRYSRLIELRYLEQKTNEETAEALGMTKENYYNKHKLAKEQYMRILRKEVQHG
jgi:RNA polymerase sigma factor (sigma-70 family)